MAAGHFKTAPRACWALGGKTLAGKTARVLGSSCYASHMALVTGEPPVTAAFEAPLVFAMQKPAAKEPDPAAVAALAALRPPDEGGGAAAASSSAADSVQGTKRKRGDEESAAASSDGGSDADEGGTDDALC